MIDDWIDPSDWPAEVQRSVALFEQGSLVEKPTFFYVGSASYGVWRFTREVGDASLPDEIFELDSEDPQSPAYGLITTETCDLVEESGKPRLPWISIAPVYRLAGLDGNSISLLRKRQVAYMRQLTAAPFESEIWVVDARVEFPFEKSWLVGRKPIEAFKTAEDKKDLAAFLAGRRDRPVLADELHAELLTPMRRWLERLGTSKREQALAGIKEVRLAVSGDPLRPDGVFLIVIGNDNALPDSVLTSWDTKWSDWREALELVGIDMLPTEYTNMDELSARKYTECFKVPLQLLLP